ncbi:hypothetical protein PORY_001348 [Pneumocystis oryctolagi]|uniref:Uncharacterized protein n=1 Tax=Pneumocystis oryctolagi TaxID=42067 RepID=A0ACB7CDY8_9ASCO|nr:hypothetical protein PORY_001348 [Pneumocystis oryctolagi]
MGLIDLILQSIRSRVSFPRIGFYDERNGLFLDLAYVTDNVIVMSLPAVSFPRKIYRNSLKDVLQFLEQRHSGHWAIFEFCKEGSGYTDKDFLFKVFHYPFPDHQPPPFRMIPEIIDLLSKHIQALENNVAVLHCKAGKGRSGMIACCYLVSENNLTVNSALFQFTKARIRKGYGDGITIMSQKRYISYVEKWTRIGRKYQELYIVISKLEIFGANKKIGCKIYGYDNENTIECLYTFLPPEMTINEATVICIPTIELICKSDICVEIYYQYKFKRVVLKDRCWFNVFFERLNDENEGFFSIEFQDFDHLKAYKNESRLFDKLVLKWKFL